MCLIEKDRDFKVGKSCGVILAGGESRRFGRDKALVELGERRLIEYGVDSLHSIFEEVFIAANKVRQFQYLDIPIVCDVIRGAGSLGGILTGLIHAKAEKCLVVACDMPLINHALIRLLLDHSNDYDVVVPLVKGEPEPLHAIYTRRCIGPIVKMILKSDYRIVNLFNLVPTLKIEEEEWSYLDPEGTSFMNINTPADFQVALRKLEQKEGMGKAYSQSERRSD